MAIQNWHELYPILHSLFQGYPDIIEPRHPLGYLVSVSDCYVTRVANRTSQAMANVLQNDPDWFADKIKFVIRTDDLPQASATLAEIRAYSDILTVWDRSLIFPQNSGPDFIIRYGTHELWIEIHTPHGCGEQGHTCRRMESSRASGISISSFEYAPYGLSQGTDATQAAEQVSQTSQAKIEKPNQFSDRYPSILWLDYCDPFIWPTEYAPGHCQPLISSWDNLLLGGIWHGFYAEEEDPIYDNINVEGYSGRPHHLQYPGHFRQNQRTDLVLRSLSYFDISVPMEGCHGETSDSS